jgi:simple sugar transport system ATP-binding protein
MAAPLIEVRDLSKHFGSVVALRGVSMAVWPGEVHCLLGDNGAGKSTLIKTLSGVHRQSAGEILLDGAPATFASPRDALDRGIATVYQDLAMIPLMSITRNFFMGREPVRGWGPLRRFDLAAANRIARDEMAKIGIDVRDPTQAVGTLSGGERQCVAIARAVYFGARVLILDEPTSALGVKRPWSCCATWPRRGPGGSASSSSPTMSTTPGPWATSSRFSIAAGRWAPSPVAP